MSGEFPAADPILCRINCDGTEISMEAVKSNNLNNETGAVSTVTDPLLIPAWDIIPPPRSMDEFICDANPTMDRSVHKVPFILTTVALILVAIGAVLNLVFTALGGFIGEFVNVSGMVESTWGYIGASQAFAPQAVLLVIAAIAAIKLIADKDTIDGPRFNTFANANKVMFIYSIFKVVDTTLVGVIGFMLPFAKENPRIPHLFRWIGFYNVYEMSCLS